MKTFKQLIESYWGNSGGYIGLGKSDFNPDERYFDRYSPKSHVPDYVKKVTLHSKPELNDHEKGALHEYVKSGYQDINHFHRKGKVKEAEYYRKQALTVDEVHAHTKHLDSAIAKHVTKAPIHVWRGIHKDAVKDLKLGKNKIVHDKGYVSTSVAPHIASGNFTDPKENHRHVMSIRVPTGSHAIYMKQHRMGDADEHEVLLPRGSRFQYSHSTEHTSKSGNIKYTVHHVTHIPEKD